jgi:hypothetical protein
VVGVVDGRVAGAAADHRSGAAERALRRRNSRSRGGSRCRQIQQKFGGASALRLADDGILKV